MDSNQLVGVLCSIERCFELDRWDVVAVAVEPLGVVLMRVIASSGEVMTLAR